MIAIPLVQRWAVERVFRPRIPGIEWLGYAKPLLRVMECFACGEEATQQGVLRATLADGRVRLLFACPACGSHRYDTPPPAAAEPQPMAFRHHVEYAADFPAIARSLAPILGGDDPGALLVAGCGFGFAVAMARAAGWVAFGFDPDPVAAAGRAALSWTVSHRPTPDPVGPGRFDALYSDGMIGRAGDPYALAVELAGRLAEGGALLVDEPDVAQLYESRDPGTVERVAGPGRAMLLPTEAGLARLLSRTGFGDHDIVAIAGRLTARRTSVEATDGDALLAGYLDDWTPARVAGDQATGCHSGLAVRALERAVNAGNWPRARDVAAALAPVLDGVNTLSALQRSDGSLDSMFAHIPFGAASAAYHAAMLALNGDGDPRRARAGFLAAAALSRAAYLAAPDRMLPELDRVWAARFHAAFAGVAAGDASAKAGFEDIAAGRTDFPLPPPNANWVARAAQQIKPVVSGRAPSTRKKRGDKS